MGAYGVGGKEESNLIICKCQFHMCMLISGNQAL